MPSPLLFTVTDPLGRTVGLRERTWLEHITPDRHPGVTINRIRDVLNEPDMIVLNDAYGSLNYFWMNANAARRYFLVAANKNRGDDPQYLVTTAYPTSIHPRSHGKTIWKRFQNRP